MGRLLAVKLSRLFTFSFLTPVTGALVRVSEGREKGRGATEFDAKSFCLDKLSTICKSLTKVVVSGSMRFDPSSLSDSLCIKVSVT